MKIFKQAFADLSQEMTDEAFNKMQKCKTYGKVDYINKTPEQKTNNEICYYDINIGLSNKIEVKSTLWVGVCPHDSEYYSFETEYNKIPKEGETIYTIINKENNIIVKYGKNDFDRYNQIAICKSELVYNYYFFSIGIITITIIFILIYILKRKKS